MRRASSCVAESRYTYASSAAISIGEPSDAEARVSYAAPSTPPRCRPSLPSDTNALPMTCKRRWTTAASFMIRFCTGRLERVGSVSGLIYAASTVGSIAGVFVSGYILIDHLTLPVIFQGTGALTAILGLICGGMHAVMCESRVKGLT